MNPLFAFAAAAIAQIAGAASAHDPTAVDPTGGGPRGNAIVIVHIGPAPEHALQVTLPGEVRPTDRAGLVQDVRDALAKADDPRPWVRGHRDAEYGAVLKIMGQLSTAGMRVSIFLDREIWRRAMERERQ